MDGSVKKMQFYRITVIKYGFDKIITIPKTKEGKKLTSIITKSGLRKGYLWFPRSGGQGDIKMFIIYVTVHEVLAYQ